MYCDTRGNGQTPGQNPRTKPPRTSKIEFVQGAFVRDFCTRPTKNWGVREVWCTFGGSPDVWQSVTEGRGSQNWPKIAWHTFWTALSHTHCSIICQQKFQNECTAHSVQCRNDNVRELGVCRNGKLWKILHPISPADLPGSLTTSR